MVPFLKVLPVGLILRAGVIAGAVWYFLL